jgi:hypothetical protein
LHKILPKVYLHKLDVQVECAVENIMGECFVGLYLVFFIGWKDSPSEGIFSCKCTIRCEGRRKNSEAGNRNGLKRSIALVSACFGVKLVDIVGIEIFKIIRLKCLKFY